jgi:hypothetical protein
VLDNITWLAFFLAFLLLFIVAMLVLRNLGGNIAEFFRTKIGLVEWKPAESWASSVIVVASIVEASLNFTQNGDTPKYLFYLSSVLVLLCPFFYNSITFQENGKRKGYLIAFLFANFLSAWGILGHIGAQFLVIQKIPFGQPTSGALYVLLTLIVLITLWYIPSRLFETIVSKLEKKRKINEGLQDAHNRNDFVAIDKFESDLENIEAKPIALL